MVLMSGQWLKGKRKKDGNREWVRVLCVVAKGELLHDWSGEPSEDVVVHYERIGWEKVFATTATEIARRLQDEKDAVAARAVGWKRSRSV